MTTSIVGIVGKFFNHADNRLRVIILIPILHSVYFHANHIAIPYIYIIHKQVIIEYASLIKVRGSFPSYTNRIAIL
jgi:hypothetical protein